MITINTSQRNINPQIAFGTTQRRTEKKLYPKGIGIANCDYFIRSNETPPDKIGQYILQEAKKASKLEMKIWGCADLSTFIARKLAMIKAAGEDEYNKIFKSVELIDIDEKIINRAKKGLIGITNPEMDDINEVLNIKIQNYLTPLVNNSDFFLDGEPRSIPQFPGSYSLFGIMPGSEQIIPCKISDTVMKGLNIHTGDIREDLKNLPASQKGVKRIFEFANGWYFIQPDEHIKIASLLSEKMKISDIMIIGNCELRQGVGKLLHSFGFKQLKDIPEAFQKVKNLTPKRLQLTKILQKFTYKGKF